MAAIFEKIRSLGHDQLANQYELLFPIGIPFELIDPNKLTLRVDQAVDIPIQSIGEVELYYHGAKVIRPNKGEETDHRITITARIDAKFEIYDAMRRWQTKVYDSLNMSSLPTGMIKSMIILRALGDNAFTISGSFSTTGTGGNVHFATEEQQLPVTKDFIFGGVWIKDLQVSSWDPATHEPSRMTMTFIFDELLENTNAMLQGLSAYNAVLDVFKNGGTISQFGKTFTGR